jgi:hypothetical protein
METSPGVASAGRTGRRPPGPAHADWSVSVVGVGAADISCKRVREDVTAVRASETIAGSRRRPDDPFIERADPTAGTRPVDTPAIPTGFVHRQGHTGAQSTALDWGHYTV